jgi:hypothetical protein
VRVYLAASAAMLRQFVDEGRIDGRLDGFAATDGLRLSLGSLGDEDLEFALTVAAAEASAAMVGVGPDGRGRRFVVVADVREAAVSLDTDNSGAVVVEGPLTPAEIDSVLADLEDVALHDGISDDLAWFATQEIVDLLVP